MPKSKSKSRPSGAEYEQTALTALHESTPDGLLADGYSGPDDLRLVEFIKAHWMRLMYGSELHRIIRNLGHEPITYGPGWRTSRGLWAKRVTENNVVIARSGVEEAQDCANVFLLSLPHWYDEVGTFLSMCRHLANVYDLKDGDTTRGVIFRDPLDGSEVRWHHAQRGRKQLRFGHYRVKIHPPGRTSVRNGKETFTPLPAGTIKREKLGRSIPPCLIHMLDAFFSGLVVQELHESGFSDVVAMHDSWFVPETSQEGKLGTAALETAIWAVARAWLEGLRDIYDRLTYYLGDDPTFGTFVHEIRSRWERRLQDRCWPNFTTG